jgi:hypothetical protein
LRREVLGSYLIGMTLTALRRIEKRCSAQTMALPAYRRVWWVLARDGQSLPVVGDGWIPPVNR